MKKLRIGFSACFFHADPARPIFKGKTLLYLEQSAVHWVFSEAVLGYLIPTVPPNSGTTLRDLVQDLDGLVLQGGSDVSPKSYGEVALRPEWGGDYARDQYEIALVKEFLAQDKPVLGICRGAQLLNVAFGGTLYQDIGTQLAKARTHRDWEIYDQNFHEIAIERGSLLERLCPGVSLAKVNSVHHQAVKDLGRGLVVEAKSTSDGVIEAIRAEGAGFAFAFQWHPEFHDPSDKSLFDSKAILREFLKHAENRKSRNA